MAHSLLLCLTCMMLENHIELQISIWKNCHSFTDMQAITAKKLVINYNKKLYYFAITSARI